MIAGEKITRLLICCMLIVQIIILPLISDPAVCFAATVNRIIAVVNDDVITETDVASLAKTLHDQDDSARAGSEPTTESQEAALKYLIEQRLMLQEAKSSGVLVSSEEVGNRLETLRARFGSEEEFEESLSGADLSKERLKEKIREQLLVEKIIDDKVRSSISVSPQEVAQVLSAHPDLSKGGDRLRLSHILIRVDAHRDEIKARSLIEEIHKKLQQGVDFADVTKRFSEDSDAKDGGLMDWVAPTELMPELAAAVAGLEVGKLSQPIQTHLGFHILRVEERRSASSLSLTEANRAIYQEIYQRKFQDKLQNWLSHLKEKAYIEVMKADEG